MMRITNIYMIDFKCKIGLHEWVYEYETHTIIERENKRNIIIQILVSKECKRCGKVVDLDD